VPSQYATIQDGINAAVNGDTVLVADGTYSGTGNWDIDFLGKAITVRSENGAKVCIIDCYQIGAPHRGFVFANGEGRSSILEGFTVKNGFVTNNGGAIYCLGSSPKITRCVFTLCQTLHGTWGGAVYCEESSPEISYCLFRNNMAGDNAGAGIHCYNESSPHIFECELYLGEGSGIYCHGYCDPLIENCTIGGLNYEHFWSFDTGGGISLVWECNPVITGCKIVGNRADNGGGGIYCGEYCNALIVNCMVQENHAPAGGGICLNNCDPTITNNTVIENSADYGGGYYGVYASPAITNCIFWNNQAPVSPELYNSVGNPTVTYCDVKGGYAGTGNIDADPLLMQTNITDLHLTYPSPCRNAGTNGAPGLPSTDFEGDPRVSKYVRQPADLIADMGADEFHYRLYFTGTPTPGSPVDVRIVGWPGEAVTLAIGTGVLDPPIGTLHGNFYLDLPVSILYMGSIPASGIAVVSGTIPSTWNPGEVYPLQALVGSWGGIFTHLTNLLLIQIV